MKIFDFLTISLGRWFGVPVYLHWTWTILFFVFTVIAGPSFGIVYMGGFLLILLHEFGHCIAAQRYGIQPINITLYPIGGAASMDITVCPKQEIVMALAGPAVNVVLLAPLLALSSFHPILRSISNINTLLFVFNLIPAFPMDGGRVLRAFLSIFWGNHLKATVVAARVGQCFCVLFGILGVMFLNPILCFVGAFIAVVAEGEIQQAKFNKKKKINVNIKDIQASSEMISDLQRRLSELSPNCEDG